jgi:hypothetical protein
MARYEQVNKDGTLADVFIVDEETLKADPSAVITLRAPLKSRAGAAPEGYEHIASVEGDRDALVTDCMVHVYAKKGAYHKEKKSALSGLKAVVAEAEIRAEATEGVQVK